MDRDRRSPPAVPDSVRRYSPSTEEAAMTQEIFDATRAGDAERVAALLAHDRSLAGARDADGLSILLFARYRSDGPILRALLGAAPTLDVFEAAALGETSRLLELLEADPALVTAWSADGFTALH